MLKALYDADVAEEDIILAWHDKQDAAKVGEVDWVGAVLSGMFIGPHPLLGCACDDAGVLPALGLCCCCEQGGLLSVAALGCCCCCHCCRCWACLRMPLLRCASLCRPLLTGLRRHPVRKRVRRRRTAMSERGHSVCAASLGTLCFGKLQSVFFCPCRF